MVKGRLVNFDGISKKRIVDILEAIKTVKVGLIGDICLDIYWKTDLTKSELSRETPHFTLPVVEEKMSPGAGGNAAANITYLEPKEFYLMGVIGNDWRGYSLLEELNKRGIDTEMVVKSNKIYTNAYCKPIRKGISDVVYEDPRLDFCNYICLPKDVEEALIEHLEQVAGKVDILCVSDQLQYGCITPIIRQKIIDFGKKGLKVVVDSRDRIGLYTNVILKPNEAEGLRAVGIENVQLMTCIKDYVNVAMSLAAKNKSAVCMTLGSKGCVYTDGQNATYVPSHDVSTPIDTCGAGDTFLAAFSCSYATGAKGYEAAAVANLAADVTIRKIGTTGTACMQEIIGRCK